MEIGIGGPTLSLQGREPDRCLMPAVALRIFLIPASALLTDHRPHGDGLVGFGFIRELAARGHVLHVAAGGVDLSGPLPENVHVHVLGSQSRVRFMGRVRRLYRRLSASTSFDLIHQLTPVDVGVSLALADSRRPLVLGPYVPDWALSGEGADPRRSVSAAARRGRGLVRRAQQRRAATVLLSTPAAASKLEVRGPTPRVRTLPPGIDARSWLPGPGGEPGYEVLFLANLEVRKGIHVLLDAFAGLLGQLPTARLVVAGTGPEGGAVQARVRAWAEAGRAKLLGHVEREQVMSTMQRCDVYCLPSFGEPFGLTALEAMACAKPVVATDAGGLAHIVDEHGGRKVPPGDAVALAAALHEVLAAPALGREMGAHNRRKIEQSYAWSRVVDRLEAAYAEALG
jgi:L-malate glycosyltransferase